MQPHTELARRPQRVRDRMEQVYAAVCRAPCLQTTDYVLELDGAAHVRADLQRLWEDGRVVRYKCPEMAYDFPECHYNSWYWATAEEAASWA